MLALVRIHVPSLTRDKHHKGHVRVSPDHIWDYVLKNNDDWIGGDSRILYMTQRYMQEDTSLIIESRDPDCLADFLLKHFASLKFVRGIWVLSLAKMRFFEVPPNHPHDMPRFTVTIDAIPENMTKIFEEISSLESSKDIIINYIVHTFQSFNASIMVSVLARSKSHAETFVNEYIKPMEGVISTDLTYIHRTIRLVSAEEWQKSFGHFYVGHGGEHIKDIDAEDSSMLSGC